MEFLTFILIFCSSILFRKEINAAPVNKISSEELKVLVYEISNSSKLQELYSKEIMMRKEECNCGDKGQCFFDENGETLCICYDGFLDLWTDGERICKECNCGEKGRCKFDEQGEKVCMCDAGYVDLGVGYEKTCK
ncbi:hypothetical protein NPIL_28701, partial [Nephila pilipes]